MSETLIGPLRAANKSEVARLHLDYLPSKFKGNPGYHLLKSYYACLAQGDGGCGFVAFKEDIIVGYVCGIWDPARIRSVVIRKYWLNLGFWGVSQIIVAPEIIRSFINRLFNSSKSFNSPNPELGYELRPIVVSREARGNGTAMKLVNQLIEDATHRGFANIHLITETDNIAAQKFYNKVGFQRVGFENRDNTTYIKFQLKIG